MASQSTPIAEPLPGPFAGPRGQNVWRERLRLLLSQRSALLGLVILAVLVFGAIFADVLTPYRPDDPLRIPGGVSARRLEPCIYALGCPTNIPETFLGTDGNSRDVLTRVLFGARISLLVGFVTVGVAILVGGSIGSVAGFAGGLLDNVLMRMMDVLLAFPALLLAIVITTVLGSGIFEAQIAIAIVAIPIYARVMRASVLAVKEQDFVTAARALGDSSSGILLRRILPNALTPLIVAGTLGIAGAVLDVAALSFVGLGAQPPTAEWGSMIGSEFNGLLSRPLIVLAPGVALTMLVLGFNLLGDGLRDALDPRLNR